MRLLLALDIHERADDALRTAVPWVRSLGARVDVAFVDEYVYNLTFVQDPSVRTVLDDQWARIRDENKAALERLVASLSEDVRGVPRYLSGRAAQEIVAAAVEYDGVLLLTHGRKGLAHFFLGSIAERIVRDAPGPVLVLRIPPQPAG